MKIKQKSERRQERRFNRKGVVMDIHRGFGQLLIILNSGFYGLNNIDRNKKNRNIILKSRKMSFFLLFKIIFRFIFFLVSINLEI